jgi:hypothetical protein
MAQNIPRGTPARVLVLLTLLVGGAAVSAWRDALRQAQDTWVVHPSALGDASLLQPDQLPVYLNTGGKIVNLTTNGAPFLRRDDKMFRVQTSTEGDLPFSLFSNQENLTGGEDPKLYARTAPGQYLRLRAGIGAIKTNALEKSGSDPTSPFGPPASAATVAAPPSATLPPSENPLEAKEAAPPSGILDSSPAISPITSSPGVSKQSPAASRLTDSPGSTQPADAILKSIPKAIPLPAEEQDFPVKPPVKRTL